MIPDASNDIFNLAADLVEQSSRNIFLTGKAGSGKTTFLKYVHDNCNKNIAIVAPTGVAAINAGGVTIHSFFQLPLSPFIPDSDDENVIGTNELLSRLKLSREKKELIRELDLLIIDEISMVRADVLDAIDVVMRFVRHSSKPFGGTQVLFIGDMYQLPPVTPEEELPILRQFYKSFYFFNSRVIQQNPPLYIEFQKIYRQTDREFIDLLNQVRNNCLTEEGIALLESRFRPSFHPTAEGEYITLTTHNYKAERINKAELDRLETKLMRYEATIQGEFPEKFYPAEKDLELKIGAQVMFLKNDLAKEKKYFNGKIGVIEKIEGDKIHVRCKNEPNTIAVGRETWENIRYTLNQRSRRIEEEELGTFTQYPLRLAWAITIHKSQGLTFDKVIVDAGEAFSAGQVYVALSRCTNLEGMVLRSRIRPHSLFVDPAIAKFSSNQSSADHIRKELDASKDLFARSLIGEIFDFHKAIASAEEAGQFIISNEQAFDSNAISWLQSLKQKFITLQEVNYKFSRQLDVLFLSRDNNDLNERLNKAADYFIRELRSVTDYIAKCQVKTQRKMQARAFNQVIRDLYFLVHFKVHMLAALKDPFDTRNVQRHRRNFQPPSFYYETLLSKERMEKVKNPELFSRLVKLRDDLCARHGLLTYLVAASVSLKEMSKYLPQTKAELQLINGFGEIKVRKYGKAFLDIIREYSSQHGLESTISEKTSATVEDLPRVRPVKDPDTKTKVVKDSDTKSKSYQLYRQGLDISAIAASRQISTSTVENHLEHYVANGELPVSELVSADKLELIYSVIDNTPDLEPNKLTPIKLLLGDHISWGELRLAMAGRRYELGRKDHLPI